MSNSQNPIFSFTSTEYDQHMQQLGYGHHAMHGLAQIPMLSSTGLNLTVMAPTGLTQGGQHHLGQLHGQHQIMYQSPAVQQQQNVTHLTHHQAQQQQQQQVQQNHHGNHQMQGHSMGGHGGQGGGHHGGGHGGQHTGGHGKGMKKKPKINKDGVPAPKRATTAYINFTQWYREELKKSGRAIPKIGEFGKECAAKWNQMQEEEKKPFLDVAAKDRDRYKREMAVFKPARDANKPKRPGTAFMLFMGDFRKEMAGKEPEGGVAALAKLGGERWRGMNEEDKRPYVEKQNEEKQRYEVAMEEYRRKSAEGGFDPLVVAAAGLVGKARLSTEASSEVGSPGDQSNSVGQVSIASTSTPGDVIMSKALATTVDNSTGSGSAGESPNMLAVATAAATGAPGQQQQQQQQSNESTSVSTSIPLNLYSTSNNIFSTSSGASGGDESPTSGQQQQSPSGVIDAANSSAATTASAQQSAQNQYSDTNSNSGASYTGYSWQ